MSASAVARRVPRLRLPAPSLNLFPVAMAFFIASCVAGNTRVLAATVKLGMGYDKSDIRFVIHFQLPQNLIAYYQQIGRAGRDGKPAYAFLLHGEEDEEILTHFIATAQASSNLLKDIVGMARSDRLLHEARGSRARCPRCARDVRHLRELPGRLHRARKRRSEHRGGSDSVLRRTTWWILGGPLPSLRQSCWKPALRACVLLR